MMIRRGILLLCLVPVAVGAKGFLEPRAPQTALQAVPFKSSSIYALDEKGGWTITVLSTPEGAYKYVLKKNNHVTIMSGELAPVDGKATVDFSLKEPTMVYLEVTPPGGKPMAFGAAVAPTKLQPVVARPKDFDSFWAGKIKELKKIPENAVVTPGESGVQDISYSTVQMDHINGTKVYGQLAKPSKPGKYPAMLVLQWASPPYPLQKSWATDPAKSGWIVLNIEPHNVPVSGPPELYSGLPTEIKNYNGIGQQDREKNYFVEMYLRGYRAADYLTKLPEWDGKTLAVTGGSMGGQQSFAVAGLHPRVTHMMVNEPAGCDLNGPNFGRQQSYPFYPANDPVAMTVSGYIDGVNFAPRIKATCLVSMGFIDTITAPAGIWTAFNQIKGPKVAAPMIEAAHNNIATWEQQQPYYTRYSKWLNALAKGEKVPLD